MSGWFVSVDSNRNASGLADTGGYNRNFNSATPLWPDPVDSRLPVGALFSGTRGVVIAVALGALAAYLLTRR